MAFIVRSVEEILSRYSKTSTLSAYARSKLSRLCDADGIINAMQYLAGQCVAEEMIFVDDDGGGIYHEYPELAPIAVEIAVNGQGDSWLIELNSANVFLFDHGSANVYDLSIGFWKFLQLADLIAQYEAAEDSAGIYEAMAELDSGLPAAYPFDLEQG